MLDIKWIKLSSVRDERGCLTAIEGVKDIPFEIKRVFYMHDVSALANRGGHAHRETDQFLVAVSGSIELLLSDGVKSASIVLSDPTSGILLPRMTWTRLYNFSESAVCLVLANTLYDMKMSIRDWSSYLKVKSINYCEEPYYANEFKR